MAIGAVFMKNKIVWFIGILASLLCLYFLLSAVLAKPQSPQPTEPSAPQITEPQNTEPEVTLPPHSALYIPDLSVEDVITYFNEVCLDSEFTTSGDPSVVQKWTGPIYYTLDGNYTDTDIAVLNSFVAWLNTIEGFPGIFASTGPHLTTLRIHFCTQKEMVNILGSNFTNMDGGVTYWYEENAIYDSTICYRTEIDQYTRNSVILEEIYNGLGPIQDTILRPDSIIYQNFSEPQALTPVDELILRLLYHPSIRPGMNRDECAQIIRQLYY